MEIDKTSPESITEVVEAISSEPTKIIKERSFAQKRRLRKLGLERLLFVKKTPRGKRKKSPHLCKIRSVKKMKLRRMVYRIPMRNNLWW
jgi:hypothetical protein